MSYSREIEDLDDWVSCAYDKNHQMMFRNLANHQLKCRAANPRLAALMDICPYNRTHHVLKEKMKEHFEVCRNYQEVLATEVREKEDRLLFGHLPSSDPPPLSPTFLQMQSERRAEEQRLERLEVGQRYVSDWLESTEDGKIFFVPSKAGNTDNGDSDTKKLLAQVTKKLERRARKVAKAQVVEELGQKTGSGETEEKTQVAKGQ